MEPHTVTLLVQVTCRSLCGGKDYPRKWTGATVMWSVSLTVSQARSYTHTSTHTQICTRISLWWFVLHIRTYIMLSVINYSSCSSNTSNSNYYNNIIKNNFSLGEVFIWVSTENCKKKNQMSCTVKKLINFCLLFDWLPVCLKNMEKQMKKNVAFEKMHVNADRWRILLKVKRWIEQ